MLPAVHSMEEMGNKIQSSITNSHHWATFSLFGSQQWVPLRTPTCRAQVNPSGPGQFMERGQRGIYSGSTRRSTGVRQARQPAESRGWSDWGGAALAKPQRAASGTAGTKWTWPTSFNENYYGLLLLKTPSSFISVIVLWCPQITYQKRNPFIS